MKRLSQRTIAMWVWVVGAAVSSALVFGPLWLVRLGVGVAMASSFAALIMVWRELDHVSRTHQLELKRMYEASKRQSNDHHHQSMEMIDRFDSRARQLTAAIGRISSQLAAAHSELATMRGNSVWLRGEIAERQARIDALEAEIGELQALREQSKGNLLSLPRLGVSSYHELLPTAEDLWADGTHPTVVDLALVFPEISEVRKQA